MAWMLFCYFFKVGWFTFGGGWSIIAQLQHDFVGKKKIMTDEEIVNLTSVGRSIPGIMVANFSCLIGYHLGGLPGALAAMAGMMLPPLAILGVVTFCYAQFRDNMYVARALVGVRAAVVPIIGMAAIRLRKSAIRDWIGVAIMLGALALCLFTNISKILIVLGGAACGLIAQEIMTRREAGRHGAA